MMTEEERQKQRKKRRKARKRKKARKKVLAVIAVIIIVLAAFVTTVKLTNPSFDFSSLLPEGKAREAVALIDGKIFGTTTQKQTQSESTSQTTTQRETKAADYDYTEFSDFDFDTSLQGNQLGNLLNKSNGAVTYSSSYIYYSIPSSGIYRFEPNEEKNSQLKVDNYNFKYLNVLGDYLYAVDTDSQTLKKIPVSGGDSVDVADGITFAYLYDDKIYFVGSDNAVGYINTSDFSKTVLYTASADKTVSFAGISLSRVFFVLHDSVADYYEYITVDISNPSDVKNFMNDSNGDSITQLYLECGFMYYYQKEDDGSFTLCRRKFGSENVVELVSSCTITDYPVVYTNRLYYSELDGSDFRAKELNMNSMDTKTMVSVSDADSAGTLAVGYGYQYVFALGTKTGDGDNICKASCIYTSSSGDNTLTFDDGELKY